MTAAEREQRNQEVLRLFLAGVSYRQIGSVVGLRSVSGVHRIVQSGLRAGAQRRALLTDEAFALHVERSERLLQAHWGPALKGDHKSADICRKMLDQNARLYGLYAEATTSLPAPTAQIDDDGEGQDDVLRLRAARRRT